MKHNTFGIIGLGKMGGNLALQALEKNWQVVGYTIGAPPQELVNAGMKPAKTLQEFVALLPQPRVILVYIPAGKAVDELIDLLILLLSKGDIILDGGNSYWGDSIQRYKLLKNKNLRFVDLGTSGGVSGARNGACFMAGADTDVFEEIKDLLQSLAVPEGSVHAGPAGAGHFTKLVHNGIEFGMLQAIGEGISLLEHWPESHLELEKILHCWNHGSVIRSWLIELMAKGYQSQSDLNKVPSFVEDTGEVNWLISDALHMEIPIPVITQSVMQLFASRDFEKHWASAIAMMRNGFGGHPFGPSQPIAQERKTGRLSDPFLTS